MRYSLSYFTLNYYSRWAQFSYRTAFISAAVTYGIVVYKAFRARTRAGSKMQGGVLALAADENVQYLGMSSYLSTVALNKSNYLLLPSYGACLALLSAVPSCHATLWRLFCLPRGNLHAYILDPYDPATAGYPCCYGPHQPLNQHIRIRLLLTALASL